MPGKSSGNVGPYLTGFCNKSNHQDMFWKVCLLKMSSQNPIKLLIKVACMVDIKLGFTD